MATHSSFLVWRIPWTEEPGGIQSVGLWRVGHDWAINKLPTESSWDWGLAWNLAFALLLSLSFPVSRCLPLHFFPPLGEFLKKATCTQTLILVSAFERAPSWRHMRPARRAGLALQNGPGSPQPFQVHQLVSKVGLESLEWGRQEPDSKYFGHCRLHIMTCEALLTPGLGCFCPCFSLWLTAFSH